MRTPRRSQQERAGATRAALVGAARELFAQRGYAAVPAEEITRAAGVTRGALYHHYADKQELFRAVFEELESEVSARIAAAVEGAPDVLAGMLAAVGTFLDACERPEVIRIGLTDAPAVLGWVQWREIESRHGLGLLVGMLTGASQAGLLREVPIEATARLLLSAAIEAALLIAHAPDPAAARAQASQALLTLLAGLLNAPPPR
jgi:AcrR family transcriptional regulator